MKKVFLGTFLHTINIYAEGEIDEEMEKEIHDYFRELTKPRVNSELAKFCKMKYLIPEADCFEHTNH